MQDQQSNQAHPNNNTQPGILYRRVSERQQLRNYKRIQAHKDSINARSKSNAETEIESLRCDENTETHGNLSVDHCEPDLEICSPSFTSSPGTLHTILGTSATPKSDTVTASPITLMSQVLSPEGYNQRELDHDSHVNAVH